MTKRMPSHTIEQTLQAIKNVTFSDDVTPAYKAVAEMAIEMVQDPGDTVADQLRFIAHEIESIAQALDEGDTEPGEPDLDMERICELIQAEGFPAYVEMTGGGTATIYAGKERQHPETKDSYYACLVGPGDFGTKRLMNVGDGDGCCYGHDNYGPKGDSEPCIYFPKGTTEQTAATAIIAFMRENGEKPE